MVLVTNALRQWCLDNGLDPAISIAVNFVSDEDQYRAMTKLVKDANFTQAARPGLDVRPFESSGIVVIPSYRSKIMMDIG
jgi:hypothetical protein